MADAKNALEKYTKAVEAVRAHQEKNKKVFDEHKELTLAMIDAENELRDQVQLEESNVANEIFRVTYSPVFRKFYDGKIVMTKADPKLRQKLLDDGCVTYEVDPQKFQNMVEQGLIPASLKQEAYKEQARNPRVTIREVQKL